MPLEACLLSCLESGLKPEAARRLSLQLDAIHHVHRPRDLAEILIYLRKKQLESAAFLVRDHIELARIRFCVPGRQGQWTARISCVNGHVFSIVIRPNPRDIMDCDKVRVVEITLLNDPMNALTLLDESTGDTVTLYGWVRELYESFGGVAVKVPAEKKILARWMKRVNTFIPEGYLTLAKQTNGMALLGGKCAVLPIDALVSQLNVTAEFLDLVRSESGTTLSLTLGDFSGDLVERTSSGPISHMGDCFESALENLLTEMTRQAAEANRSGSGGDENAAITDDLATWLDGHGVVRLCPPVSSERIERELRPIEARLPADYVELVRATNGFSLDGDRIQVMGVSEIDEVHLAFGDYYRLAEIEDAGILCVLREDLSGTVFFASFDGSKPYVVGESFISAVEEFC